MAFFDKAEEPISPFNDRDDHLLESALANPSQSFSGNDLYPTIFSKASILFYSLIKNHAFKNGNKRVASVTLYVFLWLNGFRLTAEDPSLELGTLALKVSKSEAKDKAEMLENIDLWLRKNIANTEDDEDFFKTPFFHKH